MFRICINFIKANKYIISKTEQRSPINSAIYLRDEQQQKKADYPKVKHQKQE
jgi:hypothetical protein